MAKRSLVGVGAAFLVLFGAGGAFGQDLPVPPPVPVAPAPVAAAVASVEKDAGVLVALKPGPPWSDWCVEPACKGMDPTHPARAALVKAPEMLAMLSSAGALEMQVTEKVMAAIRKLSSEALGKWDSAPMRDVLRAVTAAVTHDEAASKKTQGIAAALARATLVFVAERQLAPVLGCDGVARMNAVYEGLAMSTALSPLSFTEQTRSTSRMCAPVSQSAQNMVDGLLAGKAIPAPLLAAAAKAEKAFASLPTDCMAAADAGLSDSAKRTFRSAADVNARRTFRDLQDKGPALRKALDELRAHPSPLGDACIGAVDVTSIVEIPDLGKMASEGFSNVEVKSLVDALGLVPACKTPDACATREFLLKMLLGLRDGLKREDYIEALHFIAARLGIVVSDKGLGRVILDALEGAIVVRPEGVTVDPTEVVQRISEQFIPGAAFLRPSPFVLDLSVGMPSLSTSELRVVGDGTIGYRSKKFGIVTHGGVNYFDLSPGGGVTTDNLHAFGAFESFLLTGTDRSRWRLEGRFSGGFDYYDTTTITRPSAGTAFKFGDYDSLMWRGILEIGAQWQPSERFKAEMRGGGGLQYETYDSTSLNSKGVNFTSPETFSVRGTATLAARWRFWPRYLAGRLRAAGSVLSVTRETLSFSSVAGSAAKTSLSAESDLQIEVDARAFLDLDVIRFAGFVPGLWSGGNLVSTSVGSPVIPAAGIAILRPGE